MGAAPVAVVTTTTTMGPSYGAYGFDPKRDAEALRAAMRGLGTDEKMLIRILGCRSSPERLQIAQAYGNIYGKSLESALSSETSGNFCSLLKRLVRPTHIVKADHLQDAMEGVGTKDHWLIDVFTQTSNAELSYVRQAYHSEYHKDLEHRVKSETSGNFKKGLERLVRGVREEPPVVDERIAAEDAVTIYKAGEKKWGTDDETFIRIFTSRSAYHLQAVDRHYMSNRGKSVLDAIRNETSGDYKDLLLACCKTKEMYFAERLHECVAGIGTNDNVLVYILAINDRLTLQNIAKVYQTKYSHSLIHDLRGDTSGHYKDLISELLR